MTETAGVRGSLGRSLSSTLPADIVVEGKRDKIVLEGQPVFVRILVVIRLSRHIDKDGLGVADVLQSVVDATRDDDQGAISLADREDVQHFVRCRSWPVIVEPEAYRAPADEETVILIHVDHPSLRPARTDGSLVDVHERGIEHPPGRVVDLANLPALILDRCLVSYHDAVNEVTQ